MAVTRSIVTSNFNVHNASQFVESFSEADGNNYYVYLGRHIPYSGGDSVIVAPDNSIQSTVIDSYSDMILSKRVMPSDVIHMISNHKWLSGEIYSEYSHLDADLNNKKFFVVVNDTTEYNVYKCLSNNNESLSTIAPSRVGSSVDLNPIITGDGYVWKYMFTITKSDYDKFSSKSYVPLTANTEVISNAVAGSIEIINITYGGTGYDNYIESAVFKNGDIAISGINTLYGAPEDCVSIDDYYQGCVIKITSGSSAGEFRKIVNFEGVSSQKKFTIDTPFTNTPSVGDSYEIYPYVYVWGDGIDIVPAEGRAIIDPVANSIVQIEMLNVGSGYRIAIAVPGETPSDSVATINSSYITLPTVISSSENFRQCELLPIISPPGGHGSDPYSELFANRVCVSVKFNQSENGSIPIQNDFRQIGLIRDPLFDNVDLILDTDNTIGSFTIGETVHQFRQYKLAGDVNILSGNNIVTKTDQGLISTTIDILNGGVGYDNTSNNELVFDNTGTNGSGATGLFSNNANGTIVSLTVSSQGSGYTSIPSVMINPTAATGGSNAQFLVSLSNSDEPTFDDAFSLGDYVLINKNNTNFISKVNSIPQNYQITTTDNATFSANSSTISALKLQGCGVVSSISYGQIKLTNVKGVFEQGKKVIGLSSGATSVITNNSNSVQINDKYINTFKTTLQLSRLIGDFSNGVDPFIDDEYVSQESILSYGKPHGYLHHTELNSGSDDDILYISREYGTFNLDAAGVRTVVGNTSGSNMSSLSNKYNGDFVKGSGRIIYYENLDSITRSDNKSEIIKIIFSF